eukprot:5280502-Amphidinium_carterae.2
MCLPQPLKTKRTPRDALKDQLQKLRAMKASQQLPSATGQQKQCPHERRGLLMCECHQCELLRATWGHQVGATVFVLLDVELMRLQVRSHPCLLSSHRSFWGRMSLEMNLLAALDEDLGGLPVSMKCYTHLGELCSGTYNCRIQTISSTTLGLTARCTHYSSTRANHTT